jgi:peptide/nickel transport system permease protein
MVDNLIMRLMDVMLALPTLVLALALAAALGPSLVNALLAVAVVRLPAYVRFSRAQTLTLRHRNYVSVSRTFGAGSAHILRWHILPNALSPILVQATLDLGGTILVAAALSFIGLGAQPPTAEWGAMVSTGRNFLLDQWWYPTFPGLAILVTAMGCNLLGDGLRDLLDPRLGPR